MSVTGHSIEYLGGFFYQQMQEYEYNNLLNKKELKTVFLSLNENCI